MAERTFTLTNPTGLHARPAALLVRTVQQFAATEVFIRKGDREVNARSLLSILSLGVTVGESMAVRCEGPGAEAALDAIARLVESGFRGN